jgi:hypothetical protein
MKRSEISSHSLGGGIMAKRLAAPKRFTGKLIIGDAITITVEYEYAKLIRHLRNRALLRNFRSLDKQAGKITFEDERKELARLLTWNNDITEETFVGQPETACIAISTDALDGVVNQIIEERVLTDEKEIFPNFFEQLAAERMEPLVRMNVISGVIHLLLRSLDDAVISPLLQEPIKATIYDEGERIPRIGVLRATRQNKKNNKPRHPITSGVLMALSKSYSQIYEVVGDRDGIVGLAKIIRNSKLYSSRHTIIGDAYKAQGIEVPKETIDWIFDSAESKKMPTNAAVALELAAQQAIPDYTPRGYVTNTLKTYLRKGDKLRDINRSQTPKP